MKTDYLKSIGLSDEQIQNVMAENGKDIQKFKDENETFKTDIANANEILYPQINVTGLGDYTRNSGYTSGSVDLVWKKALYNYDRGTKISVDTMDNQESFENVKNLL
ncbi:MAG: hypothetical protein RSB67_04425 [Clostridia bacterium]